MLANAIDFLDDGLNPVVVKGNASSFEQQACFFP